MHHVSRKNEDDLKNEDDHRNEDNLKIENTLKNEDDLKNDGGGVLYIIKPLLGSILQAGTWKIFSPAENPRCS